MKPYESKKTIALIAPSGKIKDPLDIQRIEMFIRDWGFTPLTGEYIFSDHPFLSNHTQKRFVDLQNALYNDDSDMIWCIRGGSGAAELLPLLKSLSPPPKEKIFIGFSDITALHLFLHQTWGWKVFHGPCARQAVTQSVDNDSVSLVKSLLDQQPFNIVIDDLTPLNATAEKAFHLQSELIGGNLTVISHLLGTPFQPITKNKILLLEEVNEPAYKIRRMLTQLLQANILDQVNAIIFGECTNGHSHEIQWIQKELNYFAEQFDIPILQTQCIGHGKINYLIPFGEKVKLTHQSLTIDLKPFR